MKSQAWRHDPGAYDFLHEIQPRYDDIDPERHVNNVAVQAMYYEALARFQRHVLERDPLRPHQDILYPLSTDTVFLHVSHDAPPMQCGARLLALDGDGYTLALGLFQNDVCVGIQDCRVVAWSDGRRVPLPDHLRGLLAPHCHPPETEASGLPVLVSEDEDAASPLDIDNYSYLHSLSLRYGDFDVDGCTSAAAVARYLEQARSQLIFGVTEEPLDELLASEFGILAARIHIETVSHRRGTGNVQLAAGLRLTGTTSLTIRVGLFDDAGCLAVADNVLVMVNRESGKPEAIPAALKDRFAYWPYRGE